MHISPIYLQIYQKATNTLEDGAKLKLALPKRLNKVYISLVTSKCQYAPNVPEFSSSVGLYNRLLRINGRCWPS